MDELKISLGTKNSVVDVARSHAVADTLREMGHDVEIVHIPAAGDSETVGQLRLGLMRGDFDLVVHRMHRIPKQDMPGLTFAAILKRGDQRDALVARDGLTLDQLPKGTVVATRSNLRRSQLHAINPDLEFVERTPGQLIELLDKVGTGEIAAVVAGAADFEAVGRLDAVTEYLDILPAAGLGATGLECRSEDTELVSILQELDHPDTRVCVMAERAAYAALDVSDAVSVAAKARRDGVLSLIVAVVPSDGSKGLMVQMGMPTSEYHAVRTARRAAAYLRSKGAEELGRVSTSTGGESETEEGRRITELAKARILVPREEGRIARGLRGLLSARPWRARTGSPSPRCEPLRASGNLAGPYPRGRRSRPSAAARRMLSTRWDTTWTWYLRVRRVSPRSSTSGPRGMERSWYLAPRC